MATTNRFAEAGSNDVPFETLPILQSNPEFVAKADRLRYLKAVHDDCFSDKKDPATGIPAGEFGRLKIELGAMVAVAGVTSVAYHDLRIANTAASEAGAPGSGSVSGAMLVGLLSELVGEGPKVIEYVRLLEAALAAARSFDEDALMEAGVPPHVIAQARGVGKGRAGSTRVEWIGKRGRGAASKQGDGGQVQ